MNDGLHALKLKLQEGLALSMQGSYQRRLPAKAALPKIQEALLGLRELAKATPSAEAYRALALAEESMLHYVAAISSLEKAISLTDKPDRKDLKRLAALREYAAEWLAHGLAPAELRNLGHYLQEKLNEQPCDHTLKHTQAWLSSQKDRAHQQVIRAFREAGGHCDCEILSNVVAE